MVFVYDENLGQGRYRRGYYDQTRKAKFFPYSGDRNTARYILEIKGFDQMYVVLFEECDIYNLRGKILGEGRGQITLENKDYILEIIIDALNEIQRLSWRSQIGKIIDLQNEADLERIVSQYNYKIDMGI